MISTKKAARFGASCAALALCIGLAAPAHATDEDLWKHQIGIRLANVRSLVAFDADSNFFLAGYRGNIGNENVWFSKYDVSGVLLWRRQLATPEIDRVNGIATDADGNVYLAGETEGSLAGANRGDFDAWVAKYDAEGTELWARQIGSDDFDNARSVAVYPSGNVYLAGSTSGALAGRPRSSSNAWAMKLDASGTEIWRRQFGTVNGTPAQAVAADLAGNAFVAGYTTGAFWGGSRGSFDGWVTKLDGAGKELWRRQFGTKFNDFVSGVATDQAGNVIVAGEAEAAFAGPVRGSSDAILIKYDGSGREVWRRQFGTLVEDSARNLTTDVEGNIYLIGTAGTDVYAWAIRCDASGRILWRTQVRIDD